MDDTAVIITGILCNHIQVSRLIVSYSNTKIKIISTWKETDSIYIETLLDENFLVILNEPPLYITSYNLQHTCICSALLKVKELGIKYTVRSRTDIFPNNYPLFVEKTRHLYKDKITVFNYVNGHICDFVISGSTEEMMRFFSKEQAIGDTRYPEKYMIETYSNKVDLNKEDFAQYVNYCLDVCRENGIEHYWLRAVGFPKEIMKNYPFIMIEYEYFPKV
jgi:hypothetical protein